MQFQSIGLTGFSIGKLNVKPDRFVWAPRASEMPPQSVVLKALARATWSPFGHQAHLRVYKRGDDDEEGLRFTGFAPRDRDAIAAALADGGGVTLEDEPHASAGTNYGACDFAGKTLVFRGEDGRPAFDVNLSACAQCVLPGGGAVAAGAAKAKKEVTLQFAESDAVEFESHQLVEMRLCVPGARPRESAARAREKTRASGGGGGRRREPPSSPPSLPAGTCPRTTASAASTRWTTTATTTPR